MVSEGDSPPPELGKTLASVTVFGDEWGDISSSCSPTFTVTATSTECTTQAVVTAPLNGTAESGGSVGYEVAECYNTEPSNGRGKFVPISSSPGTVHVGAIVRAGEDCSSGGFVEDITIDFTLPDNFHVDCSGRSPVVHVFAGPADVPAMDDPQYESGFYYDSGEPLMGITRRVMAVNGITTNGSACQPGRNQKRNWSITEMSVDLSNVDLGFGAGKIPVGWTVYARAHTRAHAENPGEDATFTVEASTSQGALETDAFDLPETDACEEGQLPD